MRDFAGYMSVTWGRLSVICQFLEADGRLYVSYMRQDDGYLSVTWARIAVIGQLHEAGWRLHSHHNWLFGILVLRYTHFHCVTNFFVYQSSAVICQLHEAGWQLYVSYKRQVIGFLSVTWSRMTVICQLHKRQDDGYLSVTWGRLTVISQLHGAGFRCLSVT
jgi:hypothetical protein